MIQLYIGYTGYANKPGKNARCFGKLVPETSKPIRHRRIIKHIRRMNQDEMKELANGKVLVSIGNKFPDTPKSVVFASKDSS